MVSRRISQVRHKTAIKTLKSFKLNYDKNQRVFGIDTFYVNTVSVNSVSVL